MLDRLPKPVVIGAVVVVVVLAAVVVFRSVSTGGRNDVYPSREQIMQMQKGGAQNGGHAQPAGH